MNKTLNAVFILLLTTICFTSCGDDDEVDYPPFLGEWNVTERTLSTGDKDIDDWINSGLREDHRQYNMKVVYSGIEGEDNIGSYITTMNLKNSQEGTNTIRWDGKYEIKGDSIYFDDERLYHSASKIYHTGDKIMVTETAVTATYLRDLLIVLGIFGQGDRVPEGITGTLKTRYAR